jgi:8-oxo-dGTP pyrophosphatase MutT (NUDIX family)
LFARSFGKDVFYTPGGKREVGESDIDALTREISEELGVDLVRDSLEPLHVFEGPAHGKLEGHQVRLTCYTGDYVGELKPDSEIEELGWLRSIDTDSTTVTGTLVLEWLKERDMID